VLEKLSQGYLDTKILIVSTINKVIDDKNFIKVFKLKGLSIESATNPDIELDINLDVDHESLNNCEQAYHYVKSENYEEAYRLYILMAKKESDLGMFIGSLDYLLEIEKIMSHIELSDRQLFEFYYHISLALIMSRKVVSYEYIDFAYSFAEKNNEESMHIYLLETEGIYCIDIRNLERVTSIVKRITRLQKKNYNEYYEVRLLYFTSYIHQRNGRISEYILALEKSITLARKVGASKILINALSFMGADLVSARRLEEAKVVLKEALSVIGESKDYAIKKAVIQMNIAEIYGLSGSQLLRNEWIKKGFAIMKDSHRNNEMFLANLNLAESELMLNQYSEFKSVMRTALGNLVNNDLVFLKAFSLSIYARYLFKTGDTKKAYFYIGASFTSGQGIRSKMEDIAKEMYKDFDNINIPDKDELIVQGIQKNQVELSLDLFNNFDERFSKELD
ncbi:hypothetical protein OAO42_01800, partial [Candidatus Izimaplasma bacterium]|nr:hypothetical protein [Candidatus Izimaplasma bacterium]